MFLRKTENPQILEYANIPNTLFENPFSVACWVRKEESSNFRILWTIEDGSGNYIMRARFGGGNDNIVQTQMITSVNTYTASDFSLGNGGAINQWILYVCQWVPAFSRIEVYGMNATVGTPAFSSAVIAGTFGTPSTVKILEQAAMRASLGCIAIKPKLYNSTQVAAMFNSRMRNAPLFYDDANLNDDVIFASNYGIWQNPSSAESQSVINGARIGSNVAAGNYLVYRKGAGVDQSGSPSRVRPISVTDLVYEYDDTGFFTPDVTSIGNGTVGNSQVMARWARNEPSGQERIMLWGNSRTVRAVNYAASAAQTAIPFAFDGNFASGFALYRLDNLIGAINQRFASAGRMPGFETNPSGFYSTGSVTNVTNADACRGSINIGTSDTAAGQHLLLGDNAVVSRKVKELTGSKITHKDPMIMGPVYLRAPGVSNFRYRIVEATSHSAAGTAIGGYTDVTDTNTEQATRVFSGFSDTYDAGTRTLSLEGFIPPLEGWLVSIVSGTGKGSMAEIESVNVIGMTTIMVLRHAFGTGPAGGSVLSFGPWSLGTLEVEIPPSSLDFRGLEYSIDGTVASGENGAVIYAENFWMKDEAGWIIGQAGWGGNGLKPQLDNGFSNVLEQMMTVSQIDSVWITDAYQATSFATDFSAFADRCVAVDTEAVFLVGQANTIAANQETNYRNFALDQSDHPAIVVTDSPIIGSEQEQYTYSGKHNSSHPSIETFLKVAEATSLLAEANFSPGGGEGGSDMMLMGVG
jgi:hypothetical protein